MWFRFRPYVPVAQRQAQATREIEKRRKKGEVISPVRIDGRAIVRTFWGKAWCDNLEAYSDFANRLPRGRTYVRNGSVVDLKIAAGKVSALVSGSSLYTVQINIDPLKAPCWHEIKLRCSGQIGSLVELLQGKLSNSVMSVVTDRADGLFPKPSEIKMKCSCPDWAGMCKHIAAVLYGVGARLDEQPDLLFKLREVDHLELISQANLPNMKEKPEAAKVLANDQLADVFGIELSGDAEAEPEQSAEAPAAKKTAGRAKQAGAAVKVSPAKKAKGQRVRPRKPR